MSYNSMCPLEKFKQLSSPSTNLKLVLVTVCMCKCKQNKLWTCCLIGHIPHCGCSNLLSCVCNGNILAPLEHQIYWTIDRYEKNSPPRLSLRSRFGGLLSRPLEHTTLCISHLRMHLYGQPCLCIWLYSSDQSWVFWTSCRVCLLCPPGWDMGYIRKLIVWKYFDIVYN